MHKLGKAPHKPLGRLIVTTSIIAILVLLSVPPRRLTAASKDESPKLAFNGRPLNPAGTLVLDATTRQPAVGALPVEFIRSPDTAGPDGRGRYLIAVNSGFGLQFNQASNGAQQSIAVIDLMMRPAPMVIQNVYFPSPQSACIGAVFSPGREPDGSHALYVSGGFENKIWMFRFRPGAPFPVSPSSNGPNTTVQAPFIDVTGFASHAPSPNYNENVAPVYPTGLGISPDGNTLFVANNLGDSLGIISDLRDQRKLIRVDLQRGKREFVYPYGVAVLGSSGGATHKVYVSCWNTATIAVIEPGHPERAVNHVPVGNHPTAMVFNTSRTRLYVVNSDADSVSVIDTAKDREVERVDIKLVENPKKGNSPEGLALSPDGSVLYVASAHSNSVAVIDLSATSTGSGSGSARSKINGFIPTGLYPSAIAAVGKTLLIGNGKGTGFQNSSLVADGSGHSPNVPNDRFPATARGAQGGEYIVALLTGSISAVDSPDDATLARYTQQVLISNGLNSEPRQSLFKGASPIKHVIYIIKENRTYDQVFGDVARSGNGKQADGEARLAIFGNSDAARRPGGTAQNITPNQRALALRFGLLDRFFVNAEASADGHNWSTAAFSNDYVDKAFRWEYSKRGRTYDYEGFNRLPSYEPPGSLPPVFQLPVTGADVTGYMQRFVPYLNGFRDVAEPETLYLWDAAARAGLSYRNYGEFIGTVSAADVTSINKHHNKPYPDTTPTVNTLATKKSLEGHFCPTTRNFDMLTPDALTTESYRAAHESSGKVDPAIKNSNPDERFRGTSRLGAWMDEFRGFVSELKSSGADRMPNLSIMRFPNNHTSGMAPGVPTPQFAVADNDYAVGKLVEEVSGSPYWKDTAIFILEDDAQAGPDHVDGHRSPALIISAYNRPGELISEYHSTVSLIRTMEILLGMQPMNQLDAMAIPIDIFGDTQNLTPYKAVLPEVALDNLISPSAATGATAYWMHRSAEQDLSHPDMADPLVLNQAIWVSVRGARSPMPGSAHLAAFDVMKAGIADADRDDREKPKTQTRTVDDD